MGFALICGVNHKTDIGNVFSDIEYPLHQIFSLLSFKGSYFTYFVYSRYDALLGSYATVGLNRISAINSAGPKTYILRLLAVFILVFLRFSQNFDIIIKCVG